MGLPGKVNFFRARARRERKARQGSLLTDFFAIIDYYYFLDGTENVDYALVFLREEEGLDGCMDSRSDGICMDGRVWDT